MLPYPLTLPPQALAHKTLLITGASSGIGKALALACAEQGATVVLLGRNLKKLEAVYDAIEAAGYPQPAIYELNLHTAAAEHYNNLAQALAQEFGHLDGLIHNAAELGRLSPISQYPTDLWQQVLHTNLNAPFLLTRALIPLLAQSPSGRILFTSSSVAEQGRPFWGAYAVSKAACNNLMEILASELDNTRIRVNSFNPGATRTPMRAAAYPAENPAHLKTAHTLMASYIYLMSNASSHINGQQLAYTPPETTA